MDAQARFVITIMLIGALIFWDNYVKLRHKVSDLEVKVEQLRQRKP